MHRAAPAVQRLSARALLLSSICVWAEIVPHTFARARAPFPKQPLLMAEKRMKFCTRARNTQCTPSDLNSQWTLHRVEDRAIESTQIYSWNSRGIIEFLSRASGLLWGEAVWQIGENGINLSRKTWVTFSTLNPI